MGFRLKVMWVNGKLYVMTSIKDIFNFFLERYLTSLVYLNLVLTFKNLFISKNHINDHLKVLVIHWVSDDSMVKMAPGCLLKNIHMQPPRVFVFKPQSHGLAVGPFNLPTHVCG